MKFPESYLKEAIRDDIEDVRYRKDYSGRGMYSRTCVGISGSRSECMAVIAEAIVQAGLDSQKVQLGSSREETDEFFRETVETLLDFCEDSMGTGVILYWPELQNIPADVEPAA